MQNTPIVTAIQLIHNTGNVFPRTVDGIEIELHWDQPEKSDGPSARATWSVWEGGSQKTYGHLSADKAVRAWREVRAFDAWWNRPRA